MEIILPDGSNIQVDSDKEGKWYVNGKLEEIDVVKLDDGRYHVMLGHRAIPVTLRDSDDKGKLFQLDVAGRSDEVSVLDRYDSLLAEMGLDMTLEVGASDVKAPMPGLVLDVLVAEGQSVSKGDSLLILEAMKMENVIKATDPGVVGSIPVKKGDSVEKGGLLLSMD